MTYLIMLLMELTARERVKKVILTIKIFFLLRIIFLLFKDQSEICAVSGGSAAQPYAWYILLEGLSVTTNEKPKWDMDPKSRKKLENRRNN